MDHTLTRDAKKALATIYKAYKSRRASGEAKSSAVYFDTESHDAAAIDASRLRQLGRAVKREIYKNGHLRQLHAYRFRYHIHGEFVRRYHKGWLSFSAQFIP